MNVDYGNSTNKKELRSVLLPILDGWRDAIVDYCAMWNGKDNPYFHNERANVSLLVAGAWRCGAIALEEYPTEKAPLKARHRHTVHSWGRCDLLVSIKRRKKIYDFQIEAKQVWIRATKTKQ